MATHSCVLPWKIPWKGELDSGVAEEWDTAGHAHVRVRVHTHRHTHTRGEAGKGKPPLPQVISCLDLFWPKSTGSQRQEGPCDLQCIEINLPGQKAKWRKGRSRIWGRRAQLEANGKVAREQRDPAIG